MGDYLYVDGGEISQLHDGKNGSTLHPSDSGKPMIYSLKPL
jgi:hypothetical protein